MLHVLAGMQPCCSTVPPGLGSSQAGTPAQHRHRAPPHHHGRTPVSRASTDRSCRAVIGKALIIRSVCRQYLSDMQANSFLLLACDGAGQGLGWAWHTQCSAAVKVCRERTPAMHTGELALIICAACRLTHVADSSDNNSARLGIRCEVWCNGWLGTHFDW